MTITRPLIILTVVMSIAFFLLILRVCLKKTPPVQPPVPALAQPLSSLVTTFICTSPRPGDRGECTQSLSNLVVWAKQNIGGSIIICADGRASRINDKAWGDYQAKLEAVRHAHPFVIMEQSVEWLHQATLLRKAMKQHLTTPIIFCLQDDLDILIDSQEVSYIVSALRQGEGVEYVKLWWESNAASTCEDCWEAKPGDLHHTFNRLSRTIEWSDRPHFATRAHYEERVWPHFKDEDRCTMEMKISEGVVNEGMWIYGPWQTERHNRCGKMSTTARIETRGVE